MKETVQQTEGLCKEAALNIRNAYDRGYKQGYADGEKANKAVFTSGILKGREEAWECARKILHWGSIIQQDIFGMVDDIPILDGFTASEAVKRVKAWEEKQKANDEIKVGDEVIWGDSIKGIVFTIIDDVVRGFSSKLCPFEWRKEFCRKTGRHFDAIPEVLGKLAEVDHDD